MHWKERALQAAGMAATRKDSQAAEENRPLELGEPEPEEVAAQVPAFQAALGNLLGVDVTRLDVTVCGRLLGAEVDGVVFMGEYSSGHWRIYMAEACDVCREVAWSEELCSLADVGELLQSFAPGYLHLKHCMPPGEEMERFYREGRIDRVVFSDTGTHDNDIPF